MPRRHDLLRDLQQCSNLRELREMTWTRLRSTQDVSLVMLGLDGSGKTTALCKLKLGVEVPNTVPTIGFNVETMSYKKLNCTIWDVEGQAKIRKIWDYYCQAANALVFFVDSEDVDRFGESADALHTILQVGGSLDAAAPVLIFANKQDLDDAVSASCLAERLRLRELGDRPWFLQPCCAITGDGLSDGLEWLSVLLKNPSSSSCFSKPLLGDSLSSEFWAVQREGSVLSPKHSSDKLRSLLATPRPKSSRIPSVASMSVAATSFRNYISRRVHRHAAS